ncbi:hypothetical protein NYO98_10490 [Nocardioides sp. STR2]|uniref:Phage Mu protein F like protein n=1 Tax=Nocardioides pini TaxID=2975053 RepID=A0ABT4CD23_9ACTN|nr:hypothetical protein [Nocardioides pini]MCY4726706.1 hypothetical protein [Nocardioides pini]
MFWERQAARLAEALDAKAIPAVADVFDHDVEAAALTPVLRATMQRLAEVGAWDVLAAYNPDSDGWDPSMVEAYIAKAAATNAGRWSTAVGDGLAGAVADDPGNAEDAVRGFLGSNALALALAGAFVTEALSFGRHDAATKSGLRTKTWRVTSSNPRTSHAAQNGETVDIGDVFSNGLRWPGDHFGTADDNAGCTCRLDYSP